jgi:hypothetical protein
MRYMICEQTITDSRGTHGFNDDTERFRVEYSQDHAARWTTMLDGNSIG